MPRRGILRGAVEAAVRRPQGWPPGDHGISAVTNAARGVCGDDLSRLQAALHADPASLLPGRAHFPAWVVPWLKLISLLHFGVIVGFNIFCSLSHTFE